MIPFIKRVEICEAHHVHAVPTPDRRRAVITDYAPWEVLPMVGFADLEYKESREDLPEYDIRLTVPLARRVTLPDRPAVVRITDIHDSQYLIGLPMAAPPYPTLVLSDTAPGKPSETQPGRLQVLLKSMIPLINVIM